MSDILNTSADFVVRYLIAGSITAAILIPLILLIIKAARIRTPVYKHTIWLYCLIGIVLLPALWLYAPKLSIAVLPAKVEIEDTVINPEQISLIERSDIQESYVEETPPVERTPAVQSTNIAATTYHFPWKFILVGIWLSGFVFMLLRLFVGWYHLRVICNTATLAQQSKRLLRTNGQEVPVLLTSKLKGPACFGVFKPLILLPSNMYKSRHVNDVNIVLAHELAHIERGDCWINIFQRIVEACFFFHPLVWIASRQLTQQREHICDNYVLAKGISPEDYTTLLSNIGKQALKQISLPTVALFEGQLLPRVRNLLDPLRSRKTRLSFRAAIAISFTILITFIIIGCVRLTDKSNQTNNINNSDSQQSIDMSLHEAVASDNLSLVKELIDSGVDVNAKNDSGQTPLDIILSRSQYQIFTHSNHEEIKKIFLDNGAEIMSIHAAAQSGDLAEVQRLIDEGADVNAKDENNYTPLYNIILNVRNPNKDMINLLVSNGADVNYAPKWEFKPLYYAVLLEDLEIIKILVDKGAQYNVKDIDGQTALRRAALLGSINTIEFFISKGIDTSSLPMAACAGDLARVKELIEQGIDVDTKDEAGWTGLFWASCAGQTEVADFLITNSADVNMQLEEGNEMNTLFLGRDSGGTTPLHKAAETGVLDLVELLISKGADINIMNNADQTPLLNAVRAGDIKTVELLVSEGADINPRVMNNMTPSYTVSPLYLSISGGHSGIAKFLIDKGADVNVLIGMRGRNGGMSSMTLLDFAELRGHTEIVELLREHGAEE